MRRDWNVVRLRERRDLLHLRNAARMSAVRLDYVEAALMQIRDELPDGAVALAGRQGNADRFLQSFEDFDVSGYGRLLDEQDVARLDHRGKLNEERRRQGAMSIEDHHAVRADLLSLVSDVFDVALQVLGRAAEL